MALPELRAMFHLRDSLPSHWDDFESSDSPWRLLCPQDKSFSTKALQIVIAAKGIFTKSQLIYKIEEFVHKVQSDQRGRFICHFPFRNRKALIVEIDLQANKTMTECITDFCVYRGSEEFCDEAPVTFASNRCTMEAANISDIALRLLEARKQRARL